jgi:hypothetical protein
MRPLQALRHSLQHVSSTDPVTPPQSIPAPARDAPDLTASRHDAQVFTRRIVPADPYTVWLQQREAEREREERRLNPRDAWDDLRSQSFCGIERG